MVMGEYEGQKTLTLAQGLRISAERETAVVSTGVTLKIKRVRDNRL